MLGELCASREYVRPRTYPEPDFRESFFKICGPVSRKFCEIWGIVGQREREESAKLS